MSKRRFDKRPVGTLGASKSLGPIAIEWVPLESLRPAARNARTHSNKQIRQIATSIQHFGFNSPLIVDNQDRIVAGHARKDAAVLNGMREVPIIRVSHLSEAQIRSYMLADNKLAENAGWDRELLEIELRELQVLLPEINLDLGITGFEPAEVDSVLANSDSDRPDPADDIPPIDKSNAIARPGDLFVLGRHRLLVGDARLPESYVTLMGKDVAVMAILDPPYNVRISRNVSGRGRIKHGEFVCASGEMSKEQFIEFLKQNLLHCAAYSIDGAIHYIFIDWRHTGELLAAGEAVYSELKNLCVWVKNIPAQGTFYRSQHELVFVFKHGTAPHMNNFALGQYGRTRSNVWPYAGVNGFRAGRLDELTMHPTVKPVALVADAMRDCSKRGDIVLDVFAGSGTTIIAAELTGRRAFCMEIDPFYADVCVRRWQAHTKRDAILDATRQIHDELVILRTQAGGPTGSSTPDRAHLKSAGQPENPPPDKPKRASQPVRRQRQPNRARLRGKTSLTP